MKLLGNQRPESEKKITRIVRSVHDASSLTLCAGSPTEDVLQAIDDPDVAIIDSLWPKFYSGGQGFPGLRAGHIPTAVNLFVMDNLHPTDQTLLPATELAQLWHKVGLQPGQHVITYCGAGYYGAMNLFVLHQLGYEEISLYDGLWMEWGADPTLPVEVEASE